MKTDDLIAALAADAKPVSPHAVGRKLGLGGLLAAGAALLVVLAWLGVRPDLAAAALSGPFWMKAAYTLAVGAGGFLLTERLARPAGREGPGVYVIGGAVAAMLILGAWNFAFAPPDARGAAVLGQSWTLCPWRILIISAPAFAAIVWSVRRLAPTRLRLAGAAAGLLAGGVGATVYGLYCQETAAAFVAVWYTLGLAACAGVGAVVGPRVLRW